MLRVLGRLLLETKTGRRLLAGATAIGTLGVLLSGSANERTGTWSGLANHIAPHKGPISIKGKPGKSATCTVRGHTKSAVGSGWVFKGDASVAESSCEGHIEKDGRVSLDLVLTLAFDGKWKGVGGDDWEDIEGHATCEGKLEGALAQGGEWKAKCKNDTNEWETAIAWKLDD